MSASRVYLSKESFVVVWFDERAHHDGVFRVSAAASPMDDSHMRDYVTAVLFLFRNDHIAELIGDRILIGVVAHAEMSRGQAQQWVTCIHRKSMLFADGPVKSTRRNDGDIVSKKVVGVISFVFSGHVVFLLLSFVLGTSVFLSMKCDCE